MKVNFKNNKYTDYTYYYSIFFQEKDKAKLKEILVDEDIVEGEMTKYGKPNIVKINKDDFVWR